MRCFASFLWWTHQLPPAWSRVLSNMNSPTSWVGVLSSPEASIWEIFRFLSWTIAAWSRSIRLYTMEQYWTRWKCSSCSQKLNDLFTSVDYAFAFDKYDDTEVDTLMTSYDYGSVMHYERDAFAIDRRFPTIVPVMNRSAVLGQRIRLSPIDILEIQRYYGCLPTPLRPNVTTSVVRSLQHLHRSSWTMSLIWIFSMQHAMD